MSIVIVVKQIALGLGVRSFFSFPQNFYKVRIEEREKKGEGGKEKRRERGREVHSK
jgi:hypothetical protein